jgi:acetyl-CoA synthetase
MPTSRLRLLMVAMFEGGVVAWDIIHKNRKAAEPEPNLLDYRTACGTFSWEAVRAELVMPSGALNIAFVALDRHVAAGHGDRLALRWLAKDGGMEDFTYRELMTATFRFANLLKHLGVGEGDRVFSLLGRVPELYIAALGTLRNGSVFSPLFSAFGPEPVRSRMTIGEASVLVTTPALYRKKVAEWRHELPTLKHVVLVGNSNEPPVEGTIAFNDAMSTAGAEPSLAQTEPEDMALLHFTSGTTGRPKGAVHVHEAVLAHHITGRYALDLRLDDIFWCTADPGWVTGTSYGIIAPLTNGATLIVDEAEFDAERWYRVLEQEKVTVWYTAPTAIRMLMKLGGEIAKKYDLSNLRFMASVGEPLNPEAVVWSNETFGHPFHDNWWQTETGGIMIANYRSMDVRPGSMGRELPGIEAAIVERGADGVVRSLSTPMTRGELALKPGWPSIFRGYLNEEERYRKCFADGWYLTGDLAMRDADGYYWFVGRGDDVIKSAGHLIGPFEVESALLEHPAVAEAGVIGKPDPVIGEVVKAFVALKPGYAPSEALARELLGHARKRLGAAVAPKEIAFRDELPRTRSGKIMRRLLRARELGLPEGDLSTLEGGAS